MANVSEIRKYHPDCMYGVATYNRNYDPEYIYELCNLFTGLCNIYPDKDVHLYPIINKALVPNNSVKGCIKNL